MKNIKIIYYKIKIIKIEYEKIVFKLLNLHETGNNANNNNQCHYNRY